MTSSLPYIGSKISLISVNEIRYEGTFYTINTEESTIALQNVKSFGSEDRKAEKIAPSPETYDFIIFRGKDIKDLSVLEKGNAAGLKDSAIVSVNEPPVGRRISPGKERTGGYNNYRGFGGGKGKGKGGKGKGKGREYYNHGSYFRGRNNWDWKNTAVGELKANPDAPAKSEMKEDFDFLKGLQKFDKSSTVDKDTFVAEGYNKTKSFFDSISYDQRDTFGAAEKEKARQMDKEAFGEAAEQKPLSFFRRGQKGGKGYRRYEY